MMHRQFILETYDDFNGYDFFKEFKKLQSQGNFKSVKSIKSLDFKKENERDAFVISEKIGIR